MLSVASTSDRQSYVTLIEQRELKGATVQQRPDRRCAQRGDPVQAGRRDVRGDARLGDHAAVSHHDDVVEMKALLEFLDLSGERHGIGGIALEHLNGDRAAVWGAKQAIDDLPRALPAVAAVATLGKRAAASLHVA